MSKCGNCDNKLGNQGDWAKCGNCNAKFDYNCAGLTQRTWKAKSDAEREKWRCKKCRKPRTLSEKSEKDQKDQGKLNADEEEEVESDNGDNEGASQIKKKTDEKTQSEENPEQSTGLEARMIRMEAKIDKMITAYDTLQNVIKTLDFVSQEQQDLKKENEAIKKQLKTMEDRILELENREVRNKIVEQTLATMNREAKEKEQYDRNKNLEINQLDWLPDENIREVVENLAKNFNVQGFEDNHIDAVHRIPNRDKNKPSVLIIQFKHRDCRNMWLDQRKRIVTNDNMYRNGNRRRIYLNENMTPYTKSLFWKTRNFAKENNYKYVWFRNGKIMMRKDEHHEEVKIIRGEEDLLSLQTTTE